MKQISDAERLRRILAGQSVPPRTARDCGCGASPETLARLTARGIHRHA